MPPLLHRRDAGGFTLLELIVVLTIIGLISVLVAPKLAGPLADMDLKTAAQKIAASLRHARSQAAAEKATFVAVFDFDANRLVILSPPGSPPTTGDVPGEQRGAVDGRPGDPPDENGQPGRTKAYRLPEGVKLAKATAREGDVDGRIFRIVFFPSGGSSGGEVTMANERGRRYSIRVDFITGAVQLAEVRGSG